MRLQFSINQIVNVMQFNTLSGSFIYLLYICCIQYWAMQNVFPMHVLFEVLFLPLNLCSILLGGKENYFLKMLVFFFFLYTDEVFTKYRP